MSRVLALVATVPPRRHSCERLLCELAAQSRPPDGVALVLDGYPADSESPKCPLPVEYEYRTPLLLGPGARWRAAAFLPPDDILICLDDDTMLCEAPHLVRGLVAAIESGGGAAAAMGRTAFGTLAPPGTSACGDLVYAAGCGLAVRARHLTGLHEFAAEVRKQGGPDTLGLLGDDDAMVSCHLWDRGVRIVHAATGNIVEAPNMQDASHSQARLRAGQDWNAQKQALRQITGWPWREDHA